MNAPNDVSDAKKSGSKVWTLPFVALILLTILINMGGSVIIPAMPLILRGGFSESFVTWAFLSLLVARFITSNVTGGTLLRVPAPVLLAIGFALQAATMLLFLWAQEESHFLALRALEGVFEGIVIVCLQFIVAGLANDENRGRMMGIFTASFGLGFVIGPLVGSLLIWLGGLMSVFSGTAALMLVGMVATILVRKPLTPKTAAKGGSAGSGSTKQPRFTSAFIRYLPFYGGAIAQRSLFVAFIMLLPLYLVDRYGIAAHQVGYFFTLSAVMTTFIMPWTGRLGNTESKYLVTYVSLLVMAVSIFLFAWAPSLAWFTVAYVIETLAFCLMVPTAMSIFMEKIAKDELKGPIIGTASSARDVMTIIIITLVTPLYAKGGHFPWMILAGLTACAAVPYLLSARSKSKADYAQTA